MPLLTPCVAPLQYFIFLYVDAPSYQILKNLNIISTGVLYRCVCEGALPCAAPAAHAATPPRLVSGTPLLNWAMPLRHRIFLKKQLSGVQWSALILLALGCTIAQITSGSDQVRLCTCETATAPAICWHDSRRARHATRPVQLRCFVLAFMRLTVVPLRFYRSVPGGHGTYDS